MAEPSNARLRDALVHQQTRDLRVQAALLLLLERRLAALEAEIVRELRQSLSGAVQRRAVRLASIDLLVTLLAEQQLRDSVRAMEMQTARFLLRLAELEQQGVHRAVETVVGTQRFTETVPRETLVSRVTGMLILGRPLREWWQVLRASTAQKLHDTLRLGVASREPTESLVRRVQGTRARGYQDGLMTQTTTTVQSLVETAVTGTIAESRDAVYQANAAVIEAIEHVSVLVRRTGAICRARDGNRYTVRDHRPLPGTQHPYLTGPPYHLLCRSTMMPLLVGLTDRPGPSTYEQWLGRQTATVQRDVLGPARLALWRRGQIGLADLIDQRGNPLTLAQLEAQLA